MTKINIRSNLYERHGGGNVSDVVSLDDLCSCVALGLFLGLQLHLLEPLKRLQVDLLGDLGLFEDFSLKEITLYH